MSSKHSVDEFFTGELDAVITLVEIYAIEVLKFTQALKGWLRLTGRWKL